MTDPRRPKAAEIPDVVREALPRILRAHAPGHSLEAAFPMPGSGRQKYLVRAFGVPTPLVLRVYEPDERERLENAVVMSRLLKGEAPSYQIGGFDEAGAHAPFFYTLADMLWGVDAESLLEAEAVGHEDVRALGVALGGAAGAIHNVTGPGFGEPRLPAHQRDERPSAVLLQMLEDNLAAAEARGEAQPGAFARVAALTAPLFDLLDEDPGEPVLVHGRLDMSSLIVKKTEGLYRLVGVVRLGAARFLDPAYDLAFLEARVFPFYPALRDPFERAYTARRKITPALEERVELYKAVLEVMGT